MWNIGKYVQSERKSSILAKSKTNIRNSSKISLTEAFHSIKCRHIQLLVGIARHC